MPPANVPGPCVLAVDFRSVSKIFHSSNEIQSMDFRAQSFHTIKWENPGCYTSRVFSVASKAFFFFFFFAQGKRCKCFHRRSMMAGCVYVKVSWPASEAEMEYQDQNSKQKRPSNKAFRELNF